MKWTDARVRAYLTFLSISSLVAVIITGTKWGN